MDQDGVARAVERIVTEVGAWPGVTTGPHPHGGTAFGFGRGEIGHLHARGLLDVPYPKAVRDEVVSAGDARPHHTLPESGWVSFTIVAEGDVEHALALLRRSYALRVAASPLGNDPAAREGPAQPGASVEDAVDESVDESFPASDPPAVGGDHGR